MISSLGLATQKCPPHTHLNGSEEGEVSEGEHVQTWAVLVLLVRDLGWHVDKGPRYALGHGPGQLVWWDVHHSGVAQVSNLGCHGGVEEDVAGSQVPVDDGWTVVVQVHQTPGHVLEDGQLGGEGDVGRAFQKLVQAALQSLHHQHGQLRVGQEADAQELHHVRVAELGEEAALAVVPVHHALGAQVLGLDEGVVELLSRAHQPVHFQLLHNAVGASAQLPACRRHVVQEERAKLRRALQRSTDLLARNPLTDSHHETFTKNVVH